MNSKSFLNWLNRTSEIILFLPIFLFQKPVKAQIIPDQTLGEESSVINSIDQLKQQIEGGAIRGTNLFHSFQEFNIGEGNSVYFTNPAGIENILTRITGNNASNIFGKLGVSGAANLFLVNPNGIFFGPNSSLDIRGSFIATTADDIRLGENGLFSATNPENTNLLSIEPSALFFNQLATQTSGNIVNQSTTEEVGLQVSTGETLGLVGGNVLIDGGMLTAPQGRVELGSVANNSLVKLDNTQNNYALNYSEVENFENIQLNNGAVIDVSGEGSGDIQVQGRQITITEGSNIVANTLGGQPGGNVSLTASELIEVTGVSADGQNLTSIFTNVLPGAKGNGGELTINTQTLKIDRGELGANVLGAGPGGNVTINAQNLMLNNGGLIIASTSGSGQAGNITIDANEIEVVGISADGQFPSGINTTVNSTGNGGNLTIDTQNLIMRDGAIIEGGVFSSGQGGNITINATEISLSGNAMSDNILPEISNIVQAFQNQYSNIVLTVVGPEATGKGGDIIIDTQSLQLSDGSLIGTGTVGLGDSGDLTVRATEIDMTGTTPIGLLPTSVYTTVYSEGKGNGGNLTVDTERLSIRNGAQLRAGTNATGNSGDLILRATDIELIGVSESGIFASSILTSVEDFTIISLARGSGEGGNAFIETERLTILDGAEVSANTFGDGSAGSLTINASNNITISGTSPINGNSSAITASTEFGATKPGGNLNITTPTLNLSDGAVVTARSFNNSSGGNITLNVDTLNLASGAQILSSSFSDGNAGTISINADNAITVSGSDPNFNDRVAIFGVERLDTDRTESEITSNARGNGNAGSVTINTPQLRVEDRGIVTVSSSGSGVAGSLNIYAPSIQLNNGTLSAETASGDQGNITLKANQINLENNSAITTNATNTATGGDINIDTQFIIGLDNSNISANAVEGQGGNISIGAEGVFLDNNSQITATSALGIDGTVNINTQVDPTQGVVRLSPKVIDAQSLVAKNLCAPTQEKKESSSFVITGKGGLPPDPTQPLTVLRGIVEWETDTHRKKAGIVIRNDRQPVVIDRRPEVENLPEIRQAQGWVMTDSAKVILTTTAYPANMGGLQLIHPSCYVFTASVFETTPDQ